MKTDLKSFCHFFITLQDKDNSATKLKAVKTKQHLNWLGFALKLEPQKNPPINKGYGTAGFCFWRLWQEAAILAAAAFLQGLK